MINFGVIGYGYWGPNLVRNIADLAEAAVVSVAELRRDRQELARRRHPGVDIVNDACAIINDPRIDAVVIATPVGTHFSSPNELSRTESTYWWKNPFAPTLPTPKASSNWPRRRASFCLWTTPSPIPARFEK